MDRRSDRRADRIVAVLLAAGLLLGACTDDGPGRPDELGTRTDGPNPGALPTIPGGVELAPVDPSSVLVGAELAFGTPLPSEQAAADALAAGPEVASVLVRRAYSVVDGRHLADVLAVTLDGAELFDEAALAAFERGLVGAFGSGEVTTVPVAGREVLRAATDRSVTLGRRDGDLLTLATGPEAEVTLVVTRQLEAAARGEIGSVVPATPLVPVPAEAAFVPVPTVAFAPIPPPEEEPVGPEAPALAGATGVQGRYGVVAGERRTVVWAFTLDPAAYPTAEALDPALGPLVASRTGGAPVEPAEVVDRVVLAADGAEGLPSARAFRHKGLVLLVEGDRPDQLDAVVTAWITALGPG